ncbi:MAG: hypothetical protein EA370_16220, partial [Wenzhouxiangella sp.]
MLASAVQAAEPLERLAGLAVGEAFVIDGFPMGAERLGPVRFERIDLYAPGAVVRVHDGAASRVLDRSHRVFLSGRGDGVRVALAGHAGAEWSGVLLGPDGLEEVRGYA